MRNFRQALASPYPVFHSTDSGAAATNMRIIHLAVGVALVAVTSACALRSPSISELRTNPGRYYDRTVHVDGIVTSSWGVPLVPFKFYRIEDGTGEVTVVSQNARVLPTRGARVRVKGRVNEVAVLGGAPVGLHLREEKLDVRR